MCSAGNTKKTNKEESETATQNLASNKMFNIYIGLNKDLKKIQVHQKGVSLD